MYVFPLALVCFRASSFSDPRLIKRALQDMPFTEIEWVPYLWTGSHQCTLRCKALVLTVLAVAVVLLVCECILSQQQLLF